MKYLILLLTLIACKMNYSAQPEASKATTAAAATDSTVSVRVDSQFTISLRGSLGSGYNWTLNDSLDTSFLELVNQDIVSDKTESAAKPDLQRFRFQAKKPGKQTLRFIYKRPWKKTAEAGNEYRNFYITIDPN
ncbi:MAG: hypothetical protein EOO09_04995 [Chitinophagaceae bacterium]|nr:MAG: hypothetical protein EOO09_04995 [Chitinophagaceae bacterium]